MLMCWLLLASTSIREMTMRRRWHIQRAYDLRKEDLRLLYYRGLLRLRYKEDNGVRDATQWFQKAYQVNPQNYDALAELLKLKVNDYERNFAVKLVRNLLAAATERTSISIGSWGKYMQRQRNIAGPLNIIMVRWISIIGRVVYACPWDARGKPWGNCPSNG